MIGNVTKRAVDALAPGAFLWDRDLPRFGVKATNTGVKVYLLQYRIGSRSRRFTIGRHGPLTPHQARTEAIRLLGLVATGTDPAATRQVGRTAPTMRELAARVTQEHLVKRRPGTQREFSAHVRRHILPALGSLAVAAVTRADVAKLHHRLRASPVSANRMVAVLSKMFNLAERWGLRPDGSNPCRHVEKNRERPRERYLSTEELGRLGRALDQAARGPLPDTTAALSPYALAAIALLVLTGCRVSEIRGLPWEAVDLENSRLRLRETKTGARTVYLNDGARAILAGLPRVDGNPHVIVGDRPGAHLVNLTKPWYALRRAAQLDGVRMHDLRHTHASVGAAAGLSLPMIGKLLGHTQPSTTARYSHLANDPVHAAAALVGARITAAMNRPAS
jgi:integrase